MTNPWADMFPIEIETERLLIREFAPGDAAAIWHYTSAQDGIFFHEGSMAGVADVGRWLVELLKLAQEPNRMHYRFAACLQETGDLIGTARVHIDDPDDRQGSVGYALWREQWGRGLATEAATAMLDLGFERLGLHRIEATIEPDNSASVRVAEKLGMRLEGRMKERFSTPDGWRDSLLYATTEDEWRAHSAIKVRPKA
jgi:ribosomal-protein-alanine N-acetyltransferase